MKLPKPDYQVGDAVTVWRDSERAIPIKAHISAVNWRADRCGYRYSVMEEDGFESHGYSASFLSPRSQPPDMLKWSATVAGRKKGQGDHPSFTLEGEVEDVEEANVLHAVLRGLDARLEPYARDVELPVNIQLTIYPPTIEPHPPRTDAPAS